MLKVTRLESTNLPYFVFISKVPHHFGVDCVSEACKSYGKSNFIDKNALHHMGLQHGPDGWLFKNEHMAKEEGAFASSSAPFRPRFKFEKHMVRQIHFLTILCQSITHDVDDIKDKLQVDDFKDDNEEDDENEEESEA
ncbi:hypothetical protein V8G54_000380 [Vigna mungo]|uniref:Uncharacterized protein n=1 Tax=Vigna mungo TaxID=3915 RepID=A0AAQ3P4H4_VIGMU